MVVGCLLEGCGRAPVEALPLGATDAECGGCHADQAGDFSLSAHASSTLGSSAANTGEPEARAWAESEKSPA